MARWGELMPVRVRGVVYASAQECADALGVKLNTVWVALHRGTEDGIGLGRGKNRRPRPPELVRADRDTPDGGQWAVTIGPRTWRSAGALSRWLGFNSSYVTTCKLRGQWDSVVREVMLKLAREEAAMRMEMEMEVSRQAGREPWEERKIAARRNAG